jgi:glycerate kinase
MKIIIAPNSFKGSLTAFEVADCIEVGVKKVFPNSKIIKVPVADGGDGTMEVLVNAVGGKIYTKKVCGPLGNPVNAKYGILKDKKTAVIEIAYACGLRLVPKNKRNPLITTTYGVGELINEVVKRGCKKIIIGVGGSATVDGGSGMAKALGYKLLKKNGEEIKFGGGSLSCLDRIEGKEIMERYKDVEIIVALDVTNPLLGKIGAARVFGPQKGATPEMVDILERNLSRFARIIKRDLNKDVTKIVGGGAAGGLGAALYAFLNAKVSSSDVLESGISIVIKMTNLERKIKTADLVITGEGKIDTQSIYGKAPIGVAKLARKYNIPVLCIVGSIGNITEEIYKTGISSIINIIKFPMDLDYAMKNSKELLIDTAQRAAAMIKIGMKLKKYYF